MDPFYSKTGSELPGLTIAIAFMCIMCLVGVMFFLFPQDDGRPTIDLFETPSENAQAESASAGYGTAINDLRMFREPNGESKQIGLVPAGTRIYVKEIQGIWAGVKYKGLEAWVLLDQIQ